MYSHVDSLEALAKTWSGEKYWYWARRVLRKLRHGIRRAHLQGAAFAGEGETPAILLMEPQLADNVGTPMAPYLYTMSTMHCMSVSLAAGGPVWLPMNYLLKDFWKYP